MVYITQEDEDTEKALAAPLQQVGAPGLGVPQTTTPAVGGTAAVAPGTTPAGSFTGITAYLDKNRMAAAGLGRRVAGDITSKGNVAREGIGSAQQKFGDYTQSQNVGPTAETLSQLRSDPRVLANDPGKLSGFQKLQSGSYTGPNTLEESEFYAPAISALQSAQQAGTLAETPTGRAELMAQLNKSKGRRSKGVSTLDSQLLEGSEEGRAAIESAQAGLGDLPARMAEASAAGKLGVQTTRDANQSASQAIREGIAGTRGDFEKSINDRVSAARTSAAARESLARAALESMKWDASKIKSRGVFAGDEGGLVTTLSPEVLSDLGITQDDWNNLVRQTVRHNMAGLTPTKERKAAEAEGQEGMALPLGERSYTQLSNVGGLSPLEDPFTTWLQTISPETAITAANLGSKDDYEKMQALNSLAGDVQEYGLSDIALAGTAPEEGITFDTPALLQKLETLRLAREKEAKASGLYRYTGNIKNGKITSPVVGAGDINSAY